MGLSLACIVGLLIALARFRAGVLAGLTPPEDLRLDATLESEAANIKPSSLHGGRAAAAMQSALGQDDAEPGQNGKAVPPPPPIPGPTIRAVSPGVVPQRII
jgi:hypothetical protein